MQTARMVYLAATLFACGVAMAEAKVVMRIADAENSLQARGDGKFVCSRTLEISNGTAIGEQIEFSTPAGFMPSGGRFVLPAGGATNVTLAIDLPPDVEAPVVRMRHSSVGSTAKPAVEELPFSVLRSRPFRPNKKQGRLTTLDIPLATAADRVNCLGCGDLSATAVVQQRDAFWSADIVVRDAEHVSGEDGDALKIRLGAEEAELVWTDDGGKMTSTNVFAYGKFKVSRDDAKGETRYNISFVPKARGNAVPFRIAIRDADTGVAVKRAVWNGCLRFGAANEFADWGLPCAVVVDNGFTQASDFLTNYIAKINGTVLPVVSNRTEAAGRRVIELRLGAVKRDPKDNEHVYGQSYRIFSDGQDLVLQSPSVLGLTYAVSGLFQEVLGCRFYAYDYEKIPFIETICFKNVERFGKPSFQIRGSVWNVGFGKSQKEQWFMKNRCGGAPFMSVNSYHSFGEWLGKAGGKSRAETFKEHPEWFFMGADGKRHDDWMYGICGTNAKFAEAIAKAMIAEVDKRLAECSKKHKPVTELTYKIAMAQGDGFQRCFCPDCRKLVTDEGSEAAPQYLLFNRALEIATKTYPQIHIVTLAYFQTLAAPQKMKIHPNVYVELVSSCYAMNCGGDQLNEIEGVPANRHYAKSIADYCAKMPGRTSIYHWDGVDPGNSEYSEWPNVISHAKNILYWKKCGLTCAQKVDYPRPNWGGLTHWLWYNLMWDTSKDIWKMTQEYLCDYYGKDAGLVYLDYFKYLEKVRLDSSYGCPTVRWYSWAPVMIDKIFTGDVRAKMDEYMDRAIAAAKAETGRERLDHVKRCIDAKATTIDQIALNAAKTEPFRLVRDPATDRPWVIHGTDVSNIERTKRFGDYVAAHPLYWRPEQWRSLNVADAASEANVLKSGDLEAVVAPDLKGRIVSLKKGGVEIFANDGVRNGYTDQNSGWTRAWSVTNATDTSVDTFCNIGVSEWAGSYNDHWFHRRVALEDGKLKIVRAYSQPDCHKRRRFASRFSSRYELAMPDASLARVGVLGGGHKQSVSLRGADQAVAGGRNTKKDVEHVASDCQSPIFDVLEEVSATGDLTFAVTDKTGKMTVAYSRGDGISVEIETEAKGWEKVVVRPDPRRACVTIDFISDRFEGMKDEFAGPIWLALPTETVAVTGSIMRKLDPAPFVVPQGELKVKKIDADHAINLADGAEMIRIPAGAFLRGSKTGPNDERPQKKVTLSEYWIYKEPVTLYMYTNNLARIQPGAEFEPCWGQTLVLDKSVAAEKYPVLCGWYEAERYARSVGGELPTEAQWEKAARGDKDARVYPWGDDWDGSKAVGWEKTVEQFLDGMYPSGSCPAGNSPYGLVDMAGNNFEWTRDWYGHDYYKVAPDKDPKGPEKGVNKVIRGGDSNFPENFHRCAARFLTDPMRRDCVKVTFRVVVEQPLK